MWKQTVVANFILNSISINLSNEKFQFENFDNKVMFQIKNNIYNEPKYTKIIEIFIEKLEVVIWIR